ncbi:MAG: GAP family protein [Candidatus Nanopelagicales bacterium]
MAIAIALSPFPVVPSILLLFTPRARAAGAAFAGGWATGVAAATLVFAVLSGVVELAEQPAPWVSWALVAVGVALVVFGVRRWLQRGRKSEEPAWMASVSSASPGKAYRLGLGLSGANPKIVLLAAAAGLAIGDAEAGWQATVGLVLVVTVVGSLGVVTPVTLYAVAGERMLEPLGTARDWLVRHNAAITAVVIVVIGVVVVFKGLDGL